MKIKIITRLAVFVLLNTSSVLAVASDQNQQCQTGMAILNEWKVVYGAAKVVGSPQSNPAYVQEFCAWMPLAAQYITSLANTLEPQNAVYNFNDPTYQDWWLRQKTKEVACDLSFACAYMDQRSADFRYTLLMDRDEIAEKIAAFGEAKLQSSCGDQNLNLDFDTSAAMHETLNEIQTMNQETESASIPSGSLPGAPDLWKTCNQGLIEL